ncbi:MAG: hypothetical protein RIS83_1626, partial [Pseudomonadota bacterium]
MRMKRQPWRKTAMAERIALYPGTFDP